MNNVLNDNSVINPSCVIKNIVETFESIPTFDSLRKFSLKFPRRSENSEVRRVPEGIGLTGHYQGMYCIGKNSFVLVGSATGNSGYLHMFKNKKPILNTDNSSYYYPLNSNFSHPSGIQIVDNILVVGHEKYDSLKLSTKTDTSKVEFYKLNPEGGYELLSHLSFKRKDRSSAMGLVHHNDQWILAIRGDSELHFYYLEGDIFDENKTFKKFDTTFDLDESDVDEPIREFQCIQLFWGTERDSDDPELFLFGMPFGSSTHDKCAMYKIGTTKKSSRQVEEIDNYEHKAYKHFKRCGEGPRFKYASCIYFKPKPGSKQETLVPGKFKVYSCSANTDEISGISYSDGVYGIRCNEWTGEFVD